MEVSAIFCTVLAVFFLMIGHPWISAVFVSLLAWRIMTGHPKMTQPEKDLYDHWNRSPRFVFITSFIILGCIALLFCKFYFGAVLLLFGLGIALFI